MAFRNPTQIGLVQLSLLLNFFLIVSFSLWNLKKTQAMFPDMEHPNSHPGKGIDTTLAEAAPKIDEGVSAKVHWPLTSGDTDGIQTTNVQDAKLAEIVLALEAQVKNLTNTLQGRDQEHMDFIKKNLQDTDAHEEQSKDRRMFPLTCPKFNPADENRNYTVALAYHVGMVKNWKTIVNDQLHTLHRCGLGNVASDLILSYSNGDSSELLPLFEHYNFNFNLTTLVHSTKAPWEGLATNAMQEFCQHRDRPTIVFYFHNKGASTYDHDWQEHLNSTWSYANSLYWRKYLEYFTIERPNICIDRIINQNASTCGANLDVGDHYSGTFWSASCAYISSLPTMNMSNDNLGYTDAEMWIGKRMTTDRDKFVNLHYVKGGNWYESLILPEMYSDYAYRWQPSTFGDDSG